MTVFFILILLSFLLLCSAVISLIRLTVLTTNHYQVKHKAQSGDKDAKAVFPIIAIGSQLSVTLIISTIIIISVVVLLLDTQLPALFAILLATVLVVLIGEFLPMAYIRQYGISITARLAPILRYLILGLAPVARPLSKLQDRWLGDTRPSIYSKEQLYELLDHSRSTKLSAIEEDENRIVRHALSFGDKQVREVMTPRRMVVTVSADDDVGPILLDELHASGHSRFPVFNDHESQNFIGILYVHDLVGITKGGKVRELMRKRVNYVHEEQSLMHALNAFLKTSHHLLIVVNTFEEFVGVVTIEDVLEEVIGREIVDEFDNYADLRAVARSLAEKEARSRSINEKEKSSKEVKK